MLLHIPFVYRNAMRKGMQLRRTEEIHWSSKTHEMIPGVSSPSALAQLVSLEQKFSKIRFYADKTGELKRDDSVSQGS